jgi:hypothetical protein
MLRSILLAAFSTLLAIGCESSTPTEPVPQNPERNGEIKVRAPGVKVDVGRGDKKKVDVDVQPNQ